jgi:hypothetical protein
MLKLLFYLASYDGRDRRLLVVAGRRMSNVGSQEDDGLAEDLGPDARHQDRVDAAQFDVDLQAEVGQRLRRSLVHVLGLHALSGHPQDGVADPLHFGVDWSFAGKNNDDQLQTLKKIVVVVLK